MPIELRDKREDRRLCPVCYYPIPDGEEICRNCHPRKFLDSSASKKGAPRSR